MAHEEIEITTTMATSWWFVLALFEGGEILTAGIIRAKVIELLPELVAACDSEHGQLASMAAICRGMREHGILEAVVEPKANKPAQYKITETGEKLNKFYVDFCDAGNNPVRLYSSRFKSSEITKSKRGIKEMSAEVTPFLPEIKPKKVTGYIQKVTPRSHPHLFRGVAA